MTNPDVDPPVPYNAPVEGPLTSGKMLRIQGIALPGGEKFNVNLQTGSKENPRDDVALHISVRLSEGYIARNSYQDGSWGDEQGEGSLPIGAGQRFEIIILVDSNQFKIAVNGQHYCEFPQRIPATKVSHLLIDGDVDLTLISWEGNQQADSATSSTPLQGHNQYTPQPNAPAGEYNPAPQGGYGPPQGGYGPPQSGYGPPQGNYGPPQGGYGGPGGQGYVPGPPGAQEETGLEKILGSAQTYLAGAIQSGAAEKLLNSILSSGKQNEGAGGYQPQNAQYGQYPQFPPQQQQPQQNFNLPQFGGQGSVGGLGSVGSLFSSLAGQIFNPKFVVPSKNPSAGSMPLFPHLPNPIQQPKSPNKPYPLQPTTYNSSYPPPPPRPQYPPPPPGPQYPPSAGNLPLFPNLIQNPKSPNKPYPIQPTSHDASYPPPPPRPQYPPPPPGYAPYNHYPHPHQFPSPGYPHTNLTSYNYIPKKMKKSKIKKAMKYGIPIAGAGLGAFALSKAVHHKHSSSSSSSSSSSDSD